MATASRRSSTGVRTRTLRSHCHSVLVGPIAASQSSARPPAAITSRTTFHAWGTLPALLVCIVNTRTRVFNLEYCTCTVELFKILLLVDLHSTVICTLKLSHSLEETCHLYVLIAATSGPTSSSASTASAILYFTSPTSLPSSTSSFAAAGSSFASSSPTSVTSSLVSSTAPSVIISHV